MATRMQQRRGTAAQWTSANPILNAGEIGYETDTNQFKIGDGTNHWGDLSYFVDETSLSTSLGDYVETALLGVANGVATLNSSGVLESSQLPDISEITSDTMNDVLVAGSGITKSYDDNGNTITLSVDTSVLDEMSQDAIDAALTAGTGIAKTYDDNANTITISANNVPNTALANSSITVNGTEIYLGGNANVASKLTIVQTAATGGAAAETYTDISTLQFDADSGFDVTNPEAGVAKVAMNSTFKNWNIDGSAGLIAEGLDTVNLISGNNISLTANNTSGSKSLRIDTTGLAALSGATFTGDVSGTNLTLSGNLIVNGTTTNLNSTNLVIEDKNIILGDTDTPTDASANGGGITLKGTADKTFNWVDATDSWTSSENLDLATGKTFKIAGTNVLTASAVLGKSMPSGTIIGTTDTQTLTNKTISGANNTLTVRLANDVTGTLPIANGGTNLTSYTTGDILYASATNVLSKLAAGTNGYVLTMSSGVPTWSASSGGSSDAIPHPFAMYN